MLSGDQSRWWSGQEYHDSIAIGELPQSSYPKSQLIVGHAYNDNFSQYLYIADLFWTAAITSAKISLLFFYRGIFITRSFRIVSFLVDALCWIWFVVFEFVLAFSCIPVHGYWERITMPNAKCIPTRLLVLGPELTNIFLDIVILSLPVREIQKLQMVLRQKVLLSLVFLFGGL